MIQTVHPVEPTIPAPGEREPGGGQTLATEACAELIMLE